MVNEQVCGVEKVVEQDMTRDRREVVREGITGQAKEPDSSFWLSEEVSSPF